MLNSQQMEAVNTLNGPLLILAGAGSGKTTVLVNRISNMLEKGISGQNILAITFTNKAAKELRERINSKVGEKKSRDIWSSTFHSMCVRILKAHAVKTGKLLGSNFTIYDDSNSIDVVTSIITDMGLDKKEVVPKNIRYAISTLKNEMVDYETFSNNSPSNAFIDWNKASEVMRKTVSDSEKQLFTAVYKEYQERMIRYNALDFDDIILYVLDLFLEHPNVLKYYQEKFKYIMVDEYQDTNHAQYILIKLLAQKYRNLGVVGDDAQAIYKFRGANMRNILNFNKDYPDATVIKLEENYRSTDIILEAANQVIAHNTEQFPKKLYTTKKNGEKITSMQLYNDYQEAQYVTEEIEYRTRQGKSYNDIAVLFRTNTQTRPFEESFIQNHIPYILIGGLKFFDRKEIKDLVSYIKFIHNPNDVMSFKRIVNFPKRAIGPKTVDAIIAQTKERPLLEVLQTLEGVSVTKKAKEGLEKLGKSIENARNNSEKMPVDDFLRHFIEDIGIVEAFMETKDDKKHERKQNVYQLVNMAADMVYQEKIQTLDDFIEVISLYSDTEQIDENNCVKLMTVHASKGLEFSIVFVVGMEEKLFPHERSLLENDIEEERRLFYVAITRAKEKLYLTNCENRRVYGQMQNFDYSRFLEEFSFNLLDN